MASDFGDVRLRVDKGVRAEDAEQGHQRPAADGKEDGVAGHMARGLCIPPTEGAGNQRTDADAGAGAEADHDVLGREGQGQGRQAILRHAGDIDAVHDIVKRLHQHGQHDRQGQTQKQFSLVHFPHTAGIGFSVI